MLDFNEWLNGVSAKFTGYEAKNATGRGFEIPNSFFSPEETRGQAFIGEFRKDYDTIAQFYNLISGLQFSDNNTIWAKFSQGSNIVESCYTPIAYWQDGLVIRWGSELIPVNIGMSETEDYALNCTLTLSQGGYPQISYTLMEGDEISLTYICPIRVKQGVVNDANKPQWLQATTAPKAKQSLAFLADNVSPVPMQGIYVNLLDIPQNQPMEIVDYSLNERSGQGWSKIYVDVCTKNGEIFSINGKAADLVISIDKVDKNLIEGANVTLTGTREASKAKNGVMGIWSLVAPKYSDYVTSSIGDLFLEDTIEVEAYATSDLEPLF